MSLGATNLLVLDKGVEDVFKSFVFKRRPTNFPNVPRADERRNYLKLGGNIPSDFSREHQLQNLSLSILI